MTCSLTRKEYCDNMPKISCPEIQRLPGSSGRYNGKKVDMVLIRNADCDDTVV